jgi:hypothetical protein
MLSDSIMSQVPPVTVSPSEKNATLPASVPAPLPKLRSCVVCRTRKVRCDKQSPCSNCRRANIACIFPSTDRPPRWARHLERGANNAASNPPARVMERLRNLESLVKELSGQLEQANAAANLTASGSSGVNSPESSSHGRATDHQSDSSPNNNADSIQKPFGRLVVQDANRSRYVSSGFWSRVNDEVHVQVVILTGLLANFHYSLVVSIPIPQRTRPRPESPLPPKNFNGHLQNAMHSCLDII